MALSAEGATHVANVGPAASAEMPSCLPEPFERDQPRVDGGWFGLAIAKSIAACSGGRLALRSPIEGRLDGFAARSAPERDRTIAPGVSSSLIG
mgnify:CR=1 FL=1